MKKTLVPAAVLALFVMTAPTALAQETGPGTQACTDAQVALSGAPAEVDNPALPGLQRDLADLIADRDEKVNAAEGMGLEHGVSEAELTRLEALFGTEHDEAARAKHAAVKAALDAKAAASAKQGEVDNAPAVVPNPELDELTATRDEACSPPTTTTPPPADDETPPVEDDDEPGLSPEYDCRDFPLTDGTTAQDILNADGNDPHKLDLDSDGIACETSENHAGRDSDGDGVIDNRGVVEEDSLDDTSTGGLSENVTVPSGGVATGGGPA